MPCWGAYIPVQKQAREGEQVREPVFTSSQPRPVPPLPSLTRVRITGGETRPLSLNDAIRRALEHNTEIEVARVGVRLTESGLHALEGVYEPVFSITPQLSSFVTPPFASPIPAGDRVMRDSSPHASYG